jgi:hypothetical protein
MMSEFSQATSASSISLTAFKWIEFMLPYLVSILSIDVQRMFWNIWPFLFVFFEKSLITRWVKAFRQRLDSDVKFGSLDLIDVPEPLTLNSKLIEIFIHLKRYVLLLPTSSNL